METEEGQTIILYCMYFESIHMYMKQTWDSDQFRSYVLLIGLEYVAHNFYLSVFLIRTIESNTRHCIMVNQTDFRSQFKFPSRV